MLRVVVVSILIALTGPWAASCATTPSDGNGPAAPSSQQPPAQQPPAYVGDTLDLNRIGDSKIAVTLLQVIDPATVPSFMSDPDKTYVATKLAITNTGTSTVVGDANNDVSVVGSDDKPYQADLATITGCPNFLYGSFLLPPGESVTGCVAFSLPPGVTPVQIRYAPSSGLSQDVGRWRNP